MLTELNFIKKDLIEKLSMSMHSGSIHKQTLPLRTLLWLANASFRILLWIKKITMIVSC
jgi:hypothetical protein